MGGGKWRINEERPETKICQYQLKVETARKGARDGREISGQVHPKDVTVVKAAQRLPAGGWRESIVIKWNE